MDTQKSTRAVCGSPVPAPWYFPFQLLLQAGVGKRIRATVDTPGRRTLYDMAVLWLTEDRPGVEERGAGRQPQAHTTNHEAAGYRKQSARTKYLKASSRAHQVPLFAEWAAPIESSRGVELRYHLHPTSTGVCVSRSCDRLVQPTCAVPPSVEQPGDKLLSRSFRGGYRMLRLSQNLQYRPRCTIYFSAVRQCCCPEKYPLQHGRARPSLGQYFCRTPVEICEVRECVFAGLSKRLGGQDQSAKLFSILQYSEVASVAEIQNPIRSTLCVGKIVVRSRARARTGVPPCSSLPSDVQVCLTLSRGQREALTKQL